MSLLDAAKFRLRSLFRPAGTDHEREEEHAFHASLAEERAARDGSTPDEARYAARRAVGNTTYMKETRRWMGATRWVDATAQDLRYALRTLRRSPGFALVAVLSLGLGIGANAVIFGTIHSLLLAKLPVAAPKELRILAHASDGPMRALFTTRELEVLRAVPGLDFAALRGVSAPEAEVNGATLQGVSLDAVDGSYFRIAGAGLAAGRFITDADVRSASPVLVVSHQFATARYGSAATAMGRTIRLGDVAFTVIGVTEKGFEGLSFGNEYTMAVPATAVGVMLHLPPEVVEHIPAFLVTRLRADSARTRTAFEAAFNACCLKGELADQGSRRGEQRALVLDVSRGINEARKIDVRAQYESPLWALMAGVAILLLIACSNVGNLLMARATARARELAVRLSLGASRWRVMRQLLVESTLLAALGAAAGVTVAVWGSAALSRNLPPGLGMLGPFVAIRPGLTIFGFTGAVAAACAIAFGVWPAVRATRPDLVAALRDNQRAGQRTRALDRGIVSVQVGLALLLLTSAGLLVSTLRNLSSAVGGSDPGTLLVVQLDVRDTPHSRDELHAAVPAMAARFAAIPGVRSVSQSFAVPLIYGGLPTRVLDIGGLEDRPDDDVEVATITADTGYLRTLGVKLVAGRGFDARDVAGAPKVAVISETAARQLFGGRNAVGERIGFRGAGRDIEVIGVAADAKHFDLRAPAPKTLYLPLGQWPDNGDRAVWAVRTSVAPALVAQQARAIILDALPRIRIRNLQPMTELLSITTGRERLLATLAVAFGILAVTLAAIGLYGLMAFQVAARTREIGVRMALGAGAGQVVRMVLRQALALVWIGIAIGVPLALAGARALRTLLYGVTPFDPVPLAAGAGVLLAVGLVASLVPSRNAARVDPLTAIRAD